MLLNLLSLKNKYYFLSIGKSNLVKFSSLKDPSSIPRNRRSGKKKLRFPCNNVDNVRFDLNYLPDSSAHAGFKNSNTSFKNV